MMLRERVWMGLIVAVLAVLPVWSAGCSRSPATGRMQFIIINDAQEIALGTQAAAEMTASFGGLVSDEQLQAYVRAVGERVAATAEREMPYEFFLVASETPNAFALPGGKIYVTAGLMSNMSNERQLAAVLGHEIGHVTDRHNVQQLQRQMGATVLAELAAAALGGGGGSVAKIGVKVVAGMENLRYSRDNEYQADALGIRYMAAAGYNPWGMVELLQILKQGAESSQSRWMEMLRTHPLTTKRIEQATQEVRLKHAVASPGAPDQHLQRFLRMRLRLLYAMRRTGENQKDEGD